MRRTLPILIGLLIVTAVSAFAMTHGSSTLPMERAHMRGEMVNDAPVRANLGGTRADTTWYGDYQIIGGVYYARSASTKQAVDWTFDRGNGPTGDPNVLTNGEGWKAEDLTANTALYYRVIDSTLNLGAGVAAPIIDGAKSLWVGADKTQADALCWCGGAGYGNNWCQRVVSETLAYNGTGSVTLSLKYFNHTEPCYDGTQIYLKRADNTELMLNPYPAGTCTDNTAFTGGFTDSIGSWQATGGVHPGPATYTRVITAAEIGSAQNIKIVIEFMSDGGSSDEDCGAGSAAWTGNTIWGPFGADDITINGGSISKSYTFETGLQNWTPGFCTPKGLYVQIVDVGCYTILDPCGCRLAGNIMAMHADACDNGTHPVGQHVMAESPICDNSSNHNLKDIFMEFDMYAILPQENGVLIRPGWRYYPWVCDITGAVGWSPRFGQSAYNFIGVDPVCSLFRYGGTNVTGDPIPADAQKVIAIMELLGDCSAFTIANCTGVTNATPLFDNFAVGITAGAVAPSIAFENGTTYTDNGSYPSDLYDPRAVGPANVDLSKYMDSVGKPRLAGDSLTIAGPQPGSDPNKRWEARMWWRVARRSPFNSDKANGVTTPYKQWRDQVADGKQIDRPYKPEFTFGWMDSVQNGTIPLRNKFLSSFRENDDDFAGEGAAHNEMIWDDVLYPGTRIDYFITSNYVGTPNLLFYLPDTTGQFFCEFEILPGNEVANVPNCGGTGFNYCVYHPATLYIDAFNAGSQTFIENALRTVLNGLPPCADENGCKIPDNRNWDRYDYKDSASNFNVPFARSSITGSNNGMTAKQIEGYRAILVNTGTYPSGTMEEEDFPEFDSWLRSHLCGFDPERRVFIMNGDRTGEILNGWVNGTTFLTSTLGATLFCNAFNGSTTDPNCSPEEHAYCVRWLPVGGGAFGTQSDVDLYGNWCPNKYNFNVFSPLTGTPNRYYAAEGGKTMQYAQIVNQDLSANNYRTVLDGATWNHMTARNSSGSPTYCPTDNVSIYSAALSEIGSAMRWGFGVANNSQIPVLTSAFDVASCEGTWGGFPTDVGGDQTNAFVNRLYQNAPNPFNPRTAIKFSLAQSGPVQISIYDVNGRLVKTLVKGTRSAGTYSEVWDGTNDLGKKVGSGVFWSQMKTGSYVSNKKMVILK